MIKAKNRHTGVVSEFTEEKWRKLSQENSRWHDVFELVSPPEVPKEVKELEKMQAKEKAETPEVSKQEEKEPVKPIAKRASKKNTADDKK